MAADMGDRKIETMPDDAMRRIVSGQAVTDLASAVKELVDNALDAGSKNINGRCPHDDGITTDHSPFHSPSFQSGS